MRHFRCQNPCIAIVVPTVLAIIILLLVIVVVIVIVVVVVIKCKKRRRQTIHQSNVYSTSQDIIHPPGVVLYEEVPDNNIPELLPENQSTIYDETVKSVRNVLYEEQQLVPGESQKNMTNNDNEATNNTYASLNQFSSPFESEQLYCDPGSSTGSIHQQLSNTKYRELNYQNIQISTNLRSGEFSKVNRGVWNAPWGSIDVAIKTLNDNAREEEKVLFLREAAIMGQFHHPNIVKMHGVVTVGEPMMIVRELMTQGDLRQYLQQYQPIPGELAVSTLPSLLLEFSKQISSGMNYLSSKKFIHRDLAARNILVTDNAICKIGDFGMSRDLLDDNYYISHAKKIPIKWTAPEAVNFKRYSTASDIWSYGVVLYEIWSVGHKPFENCSNQECLKLIDSGYRLPPPAGCPRPIYQLMIQCWDSDTSGRPSFCDILKDLNQMDMSQCNIGSLGGPADSSLYTDIQSIYTQ